MELLIQEFVQYGALGLVAAVSIYQSWTTQKKLLKIIEDHTRASTQMTDAVKSLQGVIHDCQLIHSSREGVYHGE